MRTITTVTLLLAASMSAGCSLVPDDERQQPSTDAPAGPNPHELEGQKLHLYIADCFNPITEALSYPIRNYRSFVRRAGDPPSPDVRANGPASLRSRADVPRCRAAADRAAAMQPAMPDVQAAAEAFATSAQVLHTLFGAVERYYDRNSHRDDAMALGLEHHPRIMGAIATFEAAERSLGSLLDSINHRRTQARLAELAEDPLRRGAYLVERAQETNREMTDLAEAMQRANLDTETIPAEQRAAYLAGVQRFDAEVTQMQDYRAVPGERLPGGFSGYRSVAEGALRRHLRLSRWIREHTYFDANTLRRNVQDIVTAYNSSVRSYNNVRFAR